VNGLENQDARRRQGRQAESQGKSGRQATDGHRFLQTKTGRKKAQKAQNTKAESGNKNRP